MKTIVTILVSIFAVSAFAKSEGNPPYPPIPDRGNGMILEQTFQASVDRDNHQQLLNTLHRYGANGNIINTASDSTGNYVFYEFQNEICRVDAKIGFRAWNGNIICQSK
jgi:hypothetical protein